MKVVCLQSPNLGKNLSSLLCRKNYSSFLGLVDGFKLLGLMGGISKAEKHVNIYGEYETTEGSSP